MAKKKPQFLFIKVHHEFPEHPKVIGLSDKAFRNLIELWCYCSRFLTDGAVPQAQAAKICTPKTLKELTDAGFILATAKAIECHEYLEYQRSAAEVEALKQSRQAAGRTGGQSRAQRQASAQASAKQAAGKTQADIEIEIDTPEANASGVASASASQATKRKPADRAVRRPEGFRPGQQHIDLAAERHVDIRREWEQFRDHHDAKGSRFIDWGKAFNTWLRNARPSPNAPNQPTRVQQHLALAQRLAAEEQGLPIGELG